MKVELVRIGNSRGIRIPKPLIEQCGFKDAVELRIENDHLVIAPARQPREGWEDAFRAAGPSPHDELLLDTGNQFDKVVSGAAGRRDVLSPSPPSSKTHFLPVGNFRRNLLNLALPAGNSARILLTTHLAYALGLEGEERAAGRWRVTTPGADAPPLPSTGSGQALNQEGSP